MTIHGACLCGQVRYEITGLLSHVTHCHCSMCRRQHGAAFATYAQFEPGDFRWVSGEDRVRIYAPPVGSGWVFCGDCGSTLGGSDDGKIVSITLATVEGDPGVVPEAHIFAGSKAGWHEITDDLPRFDEWPGD